MYSISEYPPQINESVLQQLSKVETPTIGHIRDSGFMDWRLKAVIPNRRAVGTAVTIQSPSIDGSMVGYALSHSRAGDFLVIDRCGDRRHACWGGISVRAARNRGIAGVVMDGLATDFAEIRDLDVPLWCLGGTALTIKRAQIGGAVNIPVTCGGVIVKPGDAILADEMGVVVFSPEDVQKIAEEALELQEMEKSIVKRLESGESYADVTGLSLER